MMPLCGKSGRKRSKSSTPAQKVVIPKGMVNPNETTIIEIPVRLHKQPIVVAKRKNPEVRPCSGQESLYSQSSRSRTQSPRNSYREQFQQNFNPAFHSTSIHQTGHCCLPPPCMQQSSHIMEIDSNLDLDQTEEQERLQLQKDLEAFQKARRKLIESASKFATHSASNAIYDAANSVYDKNYGSSSSAYHCPRQKQRMIDPRFDLDEYSKQLYNVL